MLGGFAVLEMRLKMFYSFYQNAEYSMEDDLRYLKLYSDYDHTENGQAQNVNFTFETNSLELIQIRDTWNIDDVMGLGTELQRIIKLKKWAFELLCFNGKKLESRRYEKLNCFETIQLAKSEGYSLNCRYISLIFTQILLAAGFKARWVSCLPMELNYCECHCVAEVFIEEYKKWIVVDVALNIFYFDKKGNLLNLYDIRQHVLNNEPFRIQSTTKEHFQYVWEYWIRHVFRFKFLLNNKYNMLASSNKTFVFLNPKGFVVNDKGIIHSENDTTRFIHFYNDKLFWKES